MEVEEINALAHHLGAGTHSRKRRSMLSTETMFTVTHLPGLPDFPADWPPDMPRLPASTMTELDCFENGIRQDNNFAQACAYLGTLGGADIAETTRRVLGKLLTNRLAEAFNWAGRPPKRAFKLLRTRDLVICAVRLNPLLRHSSVPENDVDEVVKCWLRYAAWRR